MKSFGVVHSLWKLLFFVHLSYEVSNLISFLYSFSCAYSNTLYNLLQDVQDLLVSWADHLKEASAIFVRAPSYNKTIFFGGRAAPLDKKDPRIRTLPFATRRATFREAQRVHEVLSTIYIYGKQNYILGIMTCYLLIVLQPGYNQYCVQNILI